MPKKRSVEELYKGIFSMRESLQEIVQLAGDVVTMSQTFGGEIPRVITEQLNNYFIPQITKFIDDENTPGAMTPLVTFLDSVPLAMTREEPQPQQLPPATPPATTDLVEPPTGEPVEGSYAAQVQESLGRNAAGWEKHPDEVDADVDEYDEFDEFDDEYDDAPTYTPMDERKTQKGIKEYWVGAQPMLPPAWFAAYSEAGGKTKHAVLVLPTADKAEAQREFEALLPKSSRIESVSRYPGYTNFNLLESSLESRGWTFLNKDKAEAVAKEYRAKNTPRKKKESSTVKLTIGYGDWDVTEDGDSIGELIQNYFLDHGIEHDIESFSEEDIDDYREHNPDYSDVPQEPFTNVEAYFSSEKEASKFAKWLRKIAPDVLVESASRRREAKEVDKPQGTMYAVYRKNTGGSSIGEQDNMEDAVVATFDCEEAAKQEAEQLNYTVTPSEKEFFATEYYVKELECEEKEEPEGKSKKVKVDESTLNFNDGISINTDGPLRVTRKADGYYVVGEGMSMPVEDPEEGYEFILKQRGGRVKEAKGRPSVVLPIGTVNLTTGKSQYFNIYETWEGDDMHCEFWRSLMPDDKVYIVLGAGLEAMENIGATNSLIHDQSRKPLRYGKLIDNCALADLPSKASEYGRSLRGYVYK